jgi:hypothetical protein
MARLYAALYEHVHVFGQRRFITESVSNFGLIGFNDRVSSIAVFKGRDFQKGDKIRFFEHAHYQGGFLDLGPGYYLSIHFLSATRCLQRNLCRSQMSPRCLFLSSCVFTSTLTSKASSAIL